MEWTTGMGNRIVASAKTGPKSGNIRNTSNIILLFLLCIYYNSFLECSPTNNVGRTRTVQIHPKFQSRTHLNFLGRFPPLALLAFCLWEYITILFVVKNWHTSRRVQCCVKNDTTRVHKFTEKGYKMSEILGPRIQKKGNFRKVSQ